MTDEKPSLLLNWAFAELSMNAKQNTVRTKQKLKKKRITHDFIWSWFNPIHCGLFWHCYTWNKKQQITRKFNSCCENLDIDLVNTIFWFQRMCKQMDQYPQNKKLLGKKSNPKTLINFRISLKIWFSQDPWCSHNKNMCLGNRNPLSMANRVKQQYWRIRCWQYGATKQSMLTLRLDIHCNTYLI